MQLVEGLGVAARQACKVGGLHINRRWQADCPISSTVTGCPHAVRHGRTPMHWGKILGVVALFVLCIQHYR